MDNNNCTPIFYASTLGQVDCCETLIKYRANLHVQDVKGRSYDKLYYFIYIRLVILLYIYFNCT